MSRGPMKLASAPRLLARSLKAGTAIIFCTSLAMRSTAALGACAWVYSANQASTSKPFKPISAPVGTLGKLARRRGPATTSGVKRPLWMCGINDGAVVTVRSIWLDNKSVMVGPEPRYGICVMKVPDNCLKSSVAMCCTLPLPELP